MDRYMTSEYVGIGHPDKIADQISDTVLDLYLEKDSNSRVAVETLVSGDKVILAGEISSKASFSFNEIQYKIRETLQDIGYKNTPGSFNWDSVNIELYLKKQSSNIHEGVDKENGQIGAGDQGIMFGYASNETEQLLPLSYIVSSDLLNKLNDLILTEELQGFYTDNKSQTCVKYSNGYKSIDKIILSCWHNEFIELDEVRKTLKTLVIDPILSKYNKFIPKFLPELHINSAGPFYIGGPTADAGVTGRKIIVDTYGGYAPHGGGAFSGKDPSKVDRSAAYMARHIAKSLVANEYATEATVQLSYAIGEVQPFSISIKSDSISAEDFLVKRIRETFDLSPKGIIEYLKLNDPNVVKYKTIASGGHFLNQASTWEQIKYF